LNSQGGNDDDSDGWSEESDVSVIDREPDREPAAEAEAKENPTQLDVKPQVAQSEAVLMSRRCILYSNHLLYLNYDDPYTYQIFR
jgi:hypothetical protein